MLAYWQQRNGEAQTPVRHTVSAFTDKVAVPTDWLAPSDDSFGAMTQLMQIATANSNVIEGY